MNFYSDDWKKRYQAKYCVEVEYCDCVHVHVHAKMCFDRSLNSVVGCSREYSRWVGFQITFQSQEKVQKYVMNFHDIFDCSVIDATRSYGITSTTSEGENHLPRGWCTTIEAFSPTEKGLSR